MIERYSFLLPKDRGGGLAWMKYPKEDMAVTFFTPPWSTS